MRWKCLNETLEFEKKQKSYTIESFESVKSLGRSAGQMYRAIKCNEWACGVILFDTDSN